MPQSDGIISMIGKAGVSIIGLMIKLVEGTDSQSPFEAITV